jgi:hypothetical protein
MLRLFTAWRPIEGGTILEVGGGLADSGTAKWLIDHGAREVWVTNPRIDKELTRVGKVTYVSCYAQEITKVTTTTFDAIFGTAVIEHFNKLENALVSFRQVPASGWTSVSARRPDMDFLHRAPRLG